MTRHSVYFYRAIARIKAVNRKNGVVVMDRIRKLYRVSWIKAFKIFDELVGAGVLRRWKKSDLVPRPNGSDPRGNILWENINKFRVPKEVTKSETLKLKADIKSGKFEVN